MGRDAEAVRERVCSQHKHRPVVRVHRSVLLEDVDGRMVVHRPRLLGATVGERNAEDLRVGRKLGYQLEAQFAREERIVVARRDREVGGHSRDRLREPVAGEDDVLRRVEVGEQLVDLVLVVDVEVLEGARRVLADAPEPGEPERQIVVPVLVVDRRACRDVGVDPGRRFDSGDGLRVDVEVGEPPEHGQQDSGNHAASRCQGGRSSEALEPLSEGRGQLSLLRP